MKAMKEKQVRKGLEEIIEDGGEGLVLRKPNSLYVQGRSDSLIKLKATQRDAEALVIATKPHNTFVLQTPSGQTFEVQTTTIVPKKGQIVTYTHESYSRRDFPEDPHIVRIRHDLIWENVVRDSLSHPHKNASLSLNEQSKGMGSNFTTKSRMFWTANNGKNMRIFFEDFAKRNNFDPLVKDNWYNVSRESIYSQKEADSILIHFKRNYIKALMYLFPDIGLDESKFETRPVNYWDTVSNRRELFLRFAKEKGFDPLVVDNWYSVQKDDFVNSMKGARAMINQYGQHMGRALIHLFPDLHFTKEKLLPPGMRMDVRTKRNSLNQFMSSLDLDPLSPDSWYSLSASDLLSLKNLDALVYPHSNIIEALLYIYPSIGFDDSILYAKFYYYDLKIQRRFFIRFAKDNSMDPRIPQNWYSLSPSLLLRVKGASSVLWHYGGDYVAAIIALFPEINFEKEKFSIYSMQGGRERGRRGREEGEDKKRKEEKERRKTLTNDVESESEGRGQVCMIPQVLQPLSFFPSVYSSSPWWVSEGYCTGIHVIWNHSLGKLIMESGSEIGVSPAMVKLFPSCPLDGDLWCGRGMSFPVRTSANNINWSFTRFIVMDRPQVEIELLEDRYKSFLSQIDFHHPFIINNAPVLISEGRRELLNFYNKIEKNSGSGILLRKPQSEYSYLSSSSLLLQIKKLPTQSGLIVEIPTEASSFTLQLPNEDFITAPKSPHVALNLEAGDVVKFQFTHFSLQGTFVNPEIIELSESIWDDIQSQTKLITEREILREQLDRFADIKGFDSLIPENWFSVPRSSLFKELNTSLNIYKILPNMLLVAYPNSFFDPTALEQQIVRWRDIAAGRELLLKFASRQKFDYQQPDKWYSASLNKLIDKDFLGILKILGLDVLSALFYLLPEIGLERRGFNFIPRNYWKNANNKRELLLQYSKKKKFDPLVPVNWELNKRQLRVQPHMSSVLKHYDGKLGAALKDLFPETNWQEYESALNKI